MPSPLLLFIYALATWRLAVMLVDEDGPFDVFDHVRRIANRIGLGQLFSCIWCMSVWAGFLFAALMLGTNDLGGIFTYGMVLSVMALTVNAARSLYQSIHRKLGSWSFQ